MLTFFYAFNQPVVDNGLSGMFYGKFLPLIGLIFGRCWHFSMHSINLYLIMALTGCFVANFCLLLVRFMEGVDIFLHLQPTSS